MYFIGVDLHKQSITFCIVNQNRTVLERKRILCRDTKEIVALLEKWAQFEEKRPLTPSDPRRKET